MIKGSPETNTKKGEETSQGSPHSKEENKLNAEAPEEVAGARAAVDGLPGRDSEGGQTTLKAEAAGTTKEELQVSTDLRERRGVWDGKACYCCE